MTNPDLDQPFRYLGYDIDRSGSAGSWTLRERYGLGSLTFEETVTFPAPTDPTDPANEARIEAAARLVYLLSGVSYYKAGAPKVIDLGDTEMVEGDLAFLRSFYIDGLGEYAFRNELDLSDLEIKGGKHVSSTPTPAPARIRRPLIPFGGGIDSIVTVEALRPQISEGALFVMSRPGDRFAAIENAAKVTGMPVVRAGRQLDEKILRSGELGFRNGHVPITGVLSSIAVLCAAATGRDAVVMSNERSASAGNAVLAGREVNHQWSKGIGFETAFSDALARTPAGAVAYFSLLRDCTEIWIARRFAKLTAYHEAFRSCNKAFALDPARRFEHWCGVCDKCAFVDLALSPFVPAEGLRQIFAGAGEGIEPLENPALTEQLRTLVGLTGDLKPWECVGDLDECRTALVLAAERPDRAGNELLKSLVSELGAGAEPARAAVPKLMEIGRARVPESLAWPPPEGDDSAGGKTAAAGEREA